MAGSPFLTEANLKQALADTLGKADATALRVTDNLLEKANRWAYGAICDALLGRGYGDCIATWDRRVEMSESLGLFWLFTFGGISFGGPDTVLKTFDRRKELETCRVFVSGSQVFASLNTASDPAGSVGTGMMGSSVPEITW